MKKFLALLFLLALLAGGLNLTAYGMHRLLPQSPPFVVGLEREEGGLYLRLLDYRLPPFPGT